MPAQGEEAEGREREAGASRAGPAAGPGGKAESREAGRRREEGENGPECSFLISYFSFPFSRLSLEMNFEFKFG